MQDRLLILSDSQIMGSATSATLDFGIADPDKGGTPRRANVRFTCLTAGGTTGPATIGYSDNDVDTAGTFVPQGVLTIADITTVKVGDKFEIPLSSMGMKQFIRADTTSATGTGTWGIDIIAG